jgi:hypothetical protein
MPVTPRVGKPFRDFVNLMDNTFDRLFEDVDECNRQTLEEFLDSLIRGHLPEENMFMLTICSKFNTGGFTVDWLIDFLFKIIHQRYMTLHDENGDPELLEAALHADLFSHVVKWTQCSLNRYEYFFYDKKGARNTNWRPYRKLGTIIHVNHEGMNDEGEEEAGSNNDTKSERKSLADKIRSLGRPIGCSDFKDSKHIVLEVNMKPVDGVDDSHYVQQNQSMMRELETTVTYAYMRRRLAWKRWALVRGEFHKQILGYIVAYWIHETNKPDSRAFKKARTSFYSAV